MMDDPLLIDDVPFRGIVEQSLAGIYVVLDERFAYANDTFARMFGYTREEMIGRTMAQCVTPESIAEVMHNYRRRMRGEVDSIHYFTQGVHKDGHIIHLELHASTVVCRGRPALAGVALDITQRVRAQEKLRDSRERLRQLTQHLNSAREAERVRLAREVHDVLGGMLSSAKFDVSRIARRTLALNAPELQSITGDLMDLIQDTIDTARSISEALRPISLDAQGLVTTLQQTMEQFGQRHGLQVVLQLPQAALHLPTAMSTQIFRIVQEALTNVLRHAQATRVELQLQIHAQNLVLRLRDNGRGMDADTRRQGALGLLGMTERAQEIGGQIDFEPGTEGGLEVILQVPLEPEILEVQRA
jgi:PAS domain S-box-containing protein